MDELRDEIRRMVQLFDPKFGTWDELAQRILDLPEIAERLFCDCGARRTTGSCTGYCDMDE